MVINMENMQISKISKKAGTLASFSYYQTDKSYRGRNKCEDSERMNQSLETVICFTVCGGQVSNFNWTSHCWETVLERTTPRYSHVKEIYPHSSYKRLVGCFMVITSGFLLEPC